MKLKSVGSGKLERITGGSVTRGRGSAASARPSSAGKDDVALSSEARVYGMANESAQNAPEVREERIQPIREALEAGRYDVASLKVADRILRQLLMERKRSL